MQTFARYTLFSFLAALTFACSSSPELRGGVQGDEGAADDRGGALTTEDLERAQSGLGEANVSLEGELANEERAAGCAVSETLCDGKDDDCNGIVDDVDAGADGFCDCLRIGIVGSPGSNGSDTFQTWLSDRGSKVTRFDGDSEADGIQSASLDAFDVVLLDWVKADYSAEDAGRVASFVESGGGVLSMTGYANDYVDARVHNQLLSGLGAGYELRSGYFNSTEQTFFEHAITADVDQVAFYGGLPVFGPEDAEVFAEAEQGTPVGIAFQHGEGRALVWGDEWITFDSQWAELPGVETFWRNAMTYLGPQDSCQVPAPRLR